MKKLTQSLFLFLFISTISFAQPPANDDCTNATLITLVDGVGSALVDVTNATDGVDEDCDANGVWFTFVSTYEDFYIITTNADGNCDNDDTEIHVFTGADCNSLTELTSGCQDDDNTACDNNEFFEVSETIGTTFYVHVGTDGDDDDKIYNLLVSRIMNDDCADAENIFFNNGIGIADVNVTGATDGPDDDCAENSVWFKFIAPYSNFTVTTYAIDGDCDDDDTEIRVYEGMNCSSLSELTTGCQDDDNTDCENNETFSGSVSVGTMVYVSVARRGSNDDALYRLYVYQSGNIPNDDCIDAESLVLNGGIALATVNLIGATGGASEDCDEDGIWYSFPAPDSEFVVTTSNLPGTICESGDTEIHVFYGTDCGDLTELTDGCQDDDNTSCDNHETFTGIAPAGSTIFVHIGANDEGDKIVYQLQITVPALIPTMTEWGIMILSLMIAIIGIIGIRSKAIIID